MNSFSPTFLFLLTFLLLIVGCSSNGDNGQSFFETSTNTSVNAPPTGTGGGTPNSGLVSLSFSTGTTPVIVELLDSGVGISTAIGSPTPGAFSLLSPVTTSTGGAFSISSTTGVINFIGATSSGLATVTVVFNSTIGTTASALFSVIVPISFTPASPGVVSDDGSDVLGITLAEGFPLGGTFSIFSQIGGTFAVDSLTGSVDFFGPSAGLGSASVTVAYTEASIGSFNLTFVVTFSPPSVTSCTPAASGATATITGTGFSAIATVTLGGLAVTVTAVTPTTISFAVPLATSAAFTFGFTVDIVVTNPVSNTSGTSGAGAFTLIKPPAVGEFIMNEIMYDVSGSTELNFEYVEFVNVTDAILNLAGCAITDRAALSPATTEGAFTFGSAATDSVYVLPSLYFNPLPVPTGILAVVTGDEFFVFIGLRTNLTTAGVVDVAGDDTGVVFSGVASGFALSNSGETITFFASNGTTVIDAVAYLPGTPFPTSVEAVSIELSAPTLPNDTGANWVLADSLDTFTYTNLGPSPAASLPGTGTPGSAN
ncbi:MAG: hypothetical protein AABZ60_12835 [Planctomycetota bacterium]